MKYKLLKELPFLKIGSVFTTGTWTGGGWGVDLGDTHYAGGGKSHNGVKVFEKHENLILDELITNKEWVEKKPDCIEELLDLFKGGEIPRSLCIDMLKDF